MVGGVQKNPTFNGSICFDLASVVNMSSLARFCFACLSFQHHPLHLYTEIMRTSRALEAQASFAPSFVLQYLDLPP
eukprot:753915-Hanusia_phi.AAC.10